MDKMLVGKITHVFRKINVGVVELEGELSVGDRVSVEGHSRVFEQIVESMQIDRENVESANSGDSVGIKFEQHAEEGDVIFKLVA